MTQPSNILACNYLYFSPKGSDTLVLASSGTKVHRSYIDINVSKVYIKNKFKNV